MAKYNVGGFTFTDEDSAKAAAKELKAVEYILGQLKESDDSEVLKLYNKLIDQNMFSTEVGLSFLNQLRKNLIFSNAVSKDEIRPVPGYVSHGASYYSDTKEKPEKTVKQKKTRKKIAASESEEIKKLKTINKVLIVLSVSLFACILGMFYVNSTVNSPTILNYEEQILNRYSAWEQELSEREKAIKEKEQVYD